MLEQGWSRIRVGLEQGWRSTSSVADSVPFLPDPDPDFT